MKRDSNGSECMLHESGRYPHTVALGTAAGGVLQTVTRLFASLVVRHRTVDLWKRAGGMEGEREGREGRGREALYRNAGCFKVRLGWGQAGGC